MTSQTHTTVWNTALDIGAALLVFALNFTIAAIVLAAAVAFVWGLVGVLEGWT